MMTRLTEAQSKQVRSTIARPAQARLSQNQRTEAQSTMANSTTKQTPHNSGQKKAGPNKTKPNMASNKMKAVLLAGSLWVTVMGGQALALENTNASTSTATDVNNVDVNTVAVNTVNSNGLAVQAAIPPEMLKATTNISVALLSEVPTVSQNRVELAVEPLNYILPTRASIGIGSVAPISVNGSQVTSIDLSTSAISPIDVRVPVAVAAVPAEISLNLAPIPKAINPPAVEVSTQPVTVTKSSR